MNIAGIAEHNCWIDWEIIKATIYELQIDIMGMTEIGVNIKNNQVQSSFMRQQKIWQTYVLQIIVL